MFKKINRQRKNYYTSSIDDSSDGEVKDGFFKRRFKKFWRRNKGIIKYFTLVFFILYFGVNFILYKQTSKNLSGDSSKIYYEMFSSIGFKINNYNLPESDDNNVFITDEMGPYNNLDNYNRYTDLTRNLNIQMPVIETGIFGKSDSHNLYILKLREFYKINEEQVNHSKNTYLTHRFGEVFVKDNILFILSTNDEDYFNFLKEVYYNDINVDFETYKENILNNNTYKKLLSANAFGGTVSYFSLLASIILLNRLLFFPFKILFSFFKKMIDEFNVFRHQLKNNNEEKKKKETDK